MRPYSRLFLTAATLTAAPALAEAQGFQIEGGAETLYRDYHESFPAGVVGHDREGGFTGGVYGAARWGGDIGKARGLYAAIEGDYASGHTAYRGTAFNSNAPLDSQNGLANARFRAEAGKAFRLSPNLTLTPTIQGGFQTWERDLTATQTETYRYGYVGAAVRADYAVAPRWTLSARAGLAQMISPDIRFDYSRSYAGPLAARTLYQVGGGVQYALTHHWRAILSGEVDRYGFGRGPVVATVEHGRIFEPASLTTDATVRAGVAYAF